MSNNWVNILTVSAKEFKCGFCDQKVASDKGYYENVRDSRKNIYICPNCKRPNYFDPILGQNPGPKIGSEVKFIHHENVQKLFEETRKCYSIGAYSSCVMGCRKLLMNIATSEGAEEGLNYIEYVDFLNNNNFVPPRGKEWVDSIRKIGNDANHRIELKGEKEASLILSFTEMLLRFIYEMPGLMQENSISKQ